MKNDLELIKKLALAFGPSGMEDEVREMIYEEIAPYAEDIRRDASGNLIAFFKAKESNSPTLMLSAHMDEVGFMISGIEDCGVLRFSCVGGIDPSVMPGRCVTIYGHDKNKINGVIASKAIHLQKKDEQSSPITRDKLYIDIGVDSKEQAEALVEIGDCAVFDSEFVVFGDGGNRIKAKALDDRMGCAMLIELLKRLSHEGTPERLNVAICFTTREETGLSGATVAANGLSPDFAIILETTAVADLPNVEKKKRVAILGCGGALSLLDRGTIYDEQLLSLAKSYSDEIPVQLKEFVSGGNDSRHIQQTNDGCRVLALSAPTRYLHSASCVLDLRDCEAMNKLIYNLIHDLGEGAVKGR